MFPGLYPAASDNMWAFWNPQAMGLQGNFCGGDLMNQQSQAQSQAQIQAQLAALREQNNVLNQQLGLQAQTHIQHLQQLLPFHQSTFNPHPPQQEGRYGLVDKTHPSCVRPGFNTRVQHWADRRATTPPCS